MRDAIRTVAGLEVSLGAAPFSGTGDLAAAIERADRAMYEEKTQPDGRARRAEGPPAEDPAALRPGPTRLRARPILR